MGSLAIPQNTVTAVMGFLLAKGNFNPTTPTLPQSISIFGEANHANQSGLSTNPVQITSSRQAGALYGLGSPIHAAARILFNNGVNVPVWAFPQLEAAGATQQITNITTVSSATASGTIYVVVAGRNNLDGVSYAVNIALGDTNDQVNTKIATAINASVNAPVTAGTSVAGVLPILSKWYGLTASAINISIDLNNTSIGVTFTVAASATVGTGTPSIDASLALVGTAWATLIINCYGLETTSMTSFEKWNGIPDPTSPTGQYLPTVWRPSLVLCGSVRDDDSSVTNARSTHVTVVSCVAPKSQGMQYEASANVALLLSDILQNSPESDVIGLSYPDMPAPLPNQVPSMNDQSFRETVVRKGLSTVQFINGAYQIVDLVTTYNVSGEFPPYYRWVRDLNIYFNYKFGYRLIELANLVGKALIPDGAISSATNIMKPKTWKSLVSNYNKSLEDRALIVNADLNNQSIVVSIGGGSNPSRMDTTQNIQISSCGRVYATTVTGGFWFGN